MLLSKESKLLARFDLRNDLPNETLDPFCDKPTVNLVGIEPSCDTDLAGYRLQHS